jgi:heptosyltransferase I
MKILIVKTSSLGDIIHAFPVVQHLRAHYPQAQIDWVIERPFAELVQAHPALNQIFCVNTKKWRKNFWKKDVRQEMSQVIRQIRQQTYDIVIDLQGNTKSSLMMACVKGALKIGFGSASVPEWPNLFFTNCRYNPPRGFNIREDYLFLLKRVLGHFSSDMSGIQLRISEDEKKKITRLLEQPQIQGLKIMVCPGSNWTNKQLSQETLIKFLELIANKLSVHFLFIWGSDSEKERAHKLASSFPQKSLVVERLALPTLQNLMAQVQLVISMDSLPLHLAGTTPTPTYSVFGASSAQKYKPLGCSHGAFQGSCPYGKTFEKRCPILRTCSTGECIKGIDSQILFNHFTQWWTSLQKDPVFKKN